MFQDAALDKCTLRLQTAFDQWLARLKQVGGPAMTDDVVLELLADAMKAHLDGKTQHAQAVAAHLRAEALPSNVLSLDQRRADAAGWSRGAALGAAPFGQVVLEGAEDAERLHRLAHKTGKDRNALLAEAIRRGLRSLEEDPRPNDA